MRPFDDSFGYTFNLQGAVSGAHWVGASTAGVTGSRNLVIQNVANLGGLVIGKDTNTSLVSVNSGMSIAGDISIFGGQIRNQNNASLTTTTGNLLLGRGPGPRSQLQRCGHLVDQWLECTIYSSGQRQCDLVGARRLQTHGRIEHQRWHFAVGRLCRYCRWRRRDRTRLGASQ